MLQKQQTLSPDVEAVARALRKKKVGADEALRLVEHLPDKEALELLLEGAQVSRRRFTPLVVILCAFSAFLMLSSLSDRFLHWRLTAKQAVLLMIAAIPPVLNACRIAFRTYRAREDRNVDQAISQKVRTIRQTSALDALLRYCAHPFILPEARVACWTTIVHLLPKTTEGEARTLSAEARSFLHDIIEEKRLNLPQSSPCDKIAVLLVLASVKEEKTKRLVQAQLARPGLRDAAQSILDDW